MGLSCTTTTVCEGCRCEAEDDWCMAEYVMRMRMIGPRTRRMAETVHQRVSVVLKDMLQMRQQQHCASACVRHTAVESGDEVQPTSGGLDVRTVTSASDVVIELGGDEKRGAEGQREVGFATLVGAPRGAPVVGVLPAGAAVSPVQEACAVFASTSDTISTSGVSRSGTGQSDMVPGQPAMGSTKVHSVVEASGTNGHVSEASAEGCRASISEQLNTSSPVVDAHQCVKVRFPECYLADTFPVGESCEIVEDEDEMKEEEDMKREHETTRQRQVLVVTAEDEYTLPLGDGECVQKHSTCVVKGQVNDQPVRMLVDTGATGVSCVDGRFYDKHKRAFRYPLEKSPYELEVADSRRMKVRGIVRVHIRLGSVTVSWKLIVVENLRHPVLLGTDFLNEFNCVLNWRENTFTFGVKREQVKVEDGEGCEGVFDRPDDEYALVAENEESFEPGQAKHVKVRVVPEPPVGMLLV
eukprot:56786-Eustigmatos_ZCMA.PRE.1